MTEFLFQIGDALTHKALLKEPAISDPIRLFVVERTVQECPGGVQKHYLCRVLQASFSGREQIQEGFRSFHEEELILLPERTTAETTEDLLRHLESFNRRVQQQLGELKEWIKMFKKDRD